MIEEEFLQWALENKIIKKDEERSEETGYLKYKGKCPWCNNESISQSTRQWGSCSGIGCYGQNCRFTAFSIEEFKKKSHEGEPEEEVIRKSTEKKIKEYVNDLNIELNKKGYNAIFYGGVEIESEEEAMNKTRKMFYKGVEVKRGESGIYETEHITYGEIGSEDNT